MKMRHCWLGGIHGGEGRDEIPFGCCSQIGHKSSCFPAKMRRCWSGGIHDGGEGQGEG